MLNKFLDWLTVNYDNQNTIHSYHQEIKRFFDTEKEFNQETVFKYIKHLRQTISTGSVNQFIKAGRKYSKFCKVDIEFPKLKNIEEKIPDYISEEDFISILDKLPVITNSYIKWKAVLCLMFYCGLRQQEVINLTRSDFDLEKRFVKIYKTKNKMFRILPFPKEVGNLMQQYFAHEQETNNAFNVSKQSIHYIFNQIKINFGLENFYPHLLRHSCARFLLKKGIPANEVQIITGHKNMKSLQRYIRCRNEEINDLYSKKIKPAIDRKKK